MITLLALYNVHSYAIRGFHSLLAEKGYRVGSAYFKDSVYTSPGYSDGEIEMFVNRLKGQSPDVVAVSVHSPVFPLFKKFSESIRRNIGCKIAVGGEHPTADPISCVDYADYVVVGEGERAILALAEGTLKEGINFPFPLWENLDSLPVGYYGADILSYTNPRPEMINSYLTGRGCPFSCNYCHESVRHKVHGKEYLKPRRRSVDRVVDDLEYFKVFHGIRGIFFSDPIFMSDRKWLEEFCEKFPRLDMRFGCYGHATGITEDIAVMMKDAGLGNFRVGVQSGSKYIRSSVFGRKDTLEEILEAAWMMHDKNLTVTYDFIVNNPYDTSETLKETRGFIRKLPPMSRINNFELRWFPKTPLTERALGEGLIDKEDVEGNYNRFGRWDYMYFKG